MPAHDLAFAFLASGRQMELAAAGVDPHVGDAGHQVGIAGQPEAGDIEDRRQALIGHADVDVLKADDVTEILGATIECLHGANLHGMFRTVCYAPWRGSAMVGAGGATWKEFTPLSVFPEVAQSSFGNSTLRF